MPRHSHKRIGDMRIHLSGWSAFLECRFGAFYEHYDHTDKDSNVFAKELNLSIQRARATSQHQFSAGALDGTLGSLRVSIADSIPHFAMSTFHELINVAFDPDVPSV